MVWYGGRTKRHRISERDLYCAQCKGKRAFRFTLSRGYFHLFFLPLLPTGSEVTMKCNTCGTSWEVPQAPLDRTLPTFMFLDVAVFIFAVGSIFFIPYCLGVVAAVLWLFVVNYAYIEYFPPGYRDFPDPVILWQGDGEEPTDPAIIKTISFDYTPRHRAKIPPN